MSWRIHTFTKTQEKINHLIYIDNLKLFADENEFETLIQTVRIYSHDIRIEFSIEKCTMLIMWSEKRPNQEKIRTLGEKETYKYLEILEADNDERKHEKEEQENY